ncbi:MAG: class I SAM-dependent methyltransferase [Candidatus Altiarchaeota archaeon]
MTSGFFSRTSERVSHDGRTTEHSDMLLKRCRFPYDYAKTAIRPGSLTLDLGSGDGFGAGRLAGALKIVSVDSDRKTMKAQRAATTAKEHAMAVSRAESLPFKEGVFDAVLSFQLIEHLSDDDAFASEASRVLSRAGVMYLTSPNRLLRLKPGENPWNRFHVREYDKKALQEVLHPHFKRIEFFGVTATPEIMEIEMERIRQIRRISSLDVLNLRAKMPEWLRYCVAEGMKKVAGGKNGKAPAVEPRPDGFKLSKDMDGCLDILAVCRR